MDLKPRMRPLDYQLVHHQGQQMWYLRDPLQLSERQLLLPPALALIVNDCDGTRTVAELAAALSAELGISVPYDTVADVLAQLDEACLLDNDHARAARAARLVEYRGLPNRSPALAGLSYAATARGLRDELAGYGAALDAESGRWQGRGLISPHIDYMRGGPVYARVWGAARDAVAEADLVLMFGTDHNGGPGTLTLTRQRYATPFGVLPTDLDLVDQLAEAIGEEDAYGLELNHRQEHAIELSAVWLHAAAPENAPPLVPVLCGSFQHFVSNGGHPARDATINRFLETLQTATAGRKVLAVASVDFAHVGPEFGDALPMDAARRARLRAADERLLAAIGAGDAEAFYQQIAAVEDSNRICGFSSIYLMLRYLGAAAGRTVAYEQCPADDAGASLVSIAGMLLE